MNIENNKTQVNEKRRHPRTKFLCHLELKKKSGKYKCVTMNLSRSGIALLSDRKIDTGDCTLLLENTKLDGTILYRIQEGKGFVMQDSAMFRYGIRFATPLTDAVKDDLIRKFNGGM